MANLNSDSPSEDDLLYMLHHVFLPPKLPQQDDSDVERDIALCDLTHRTSLEFQRFLSDLQQQQWSSVSRMLQMLLQTTRNLDQGILEKNILDLGEGGSLALQIHAQNAAVIMRKHKDCMIFESFEVQPLPEAVMQAEGKLLCSYPGPAVEIPLSVAQDPLFVEQLASFLVHMHFDKLPEAQPKTVKAGSKVIETRSTAHPRYITQLLSMILLGMGKEAHVKRITKRIADDICFGGKDPWRRSPLWLVIRVAIQTSVDSLDTYKQFMIFLQMKLLRLFLDHDLPSEMLYVTRFKTTRRIDKLGAAASSHLDAMKTLCEEIEERLQDRWSKEQKHQALSPSFTPVPSDFEKHTALTLLESRTYLEKVMHPDCYTPPSAEFCPSHLPRIQDIHDFYGIKDNLLTNTVKGDPYIALADFEFIVQERLDSWVDANKDHEPASRTLESCLKQYCSAARTLYSSSPEDESLMLLTIMELWVALDIIAVVQCPLLASYSPEIPASFLDPLLLRRAKSLNRAAKIQSYLQKRHTNATCMTSVYSNVLSEDAFAIRYFQSSPHLQTLRDEITQSANDERNRKCVELRKMNEEHEEISQKINRLYCQCDYILRPYHKCERCRLQRDAANMTIAVHEWPLPNNDLEVKAIVFELKCPGVFAIWRSWTYGVLRDYGMSHKPPSRFSPYVTLEKYTGLTKWSKPGTSGRIAFGSATNSFLGTHHGTVHIPARQDSICVNNGLHFQLYDGTREERVALPFDLDLTNFCTLQLHDDGEPMYQHLQEAVAHTTHTPNEIIANQSDCPETLNMHEHLAFANLRCGSQLQWTNIARELHTNTLTFRREEVHTLITQAIWQIGPLSLNGCQREWHYEATVPQFGHVLIREGKELLSHVEANWMEIAAVKSIIYLISRLLISIHNDCVDVRSEGYDLLRKARDITYKWMGEILRKLEDNIGDEQADELRRRVCEIAATCRATYDVETDQIRSLLNCPADFSILIECSIIIHNNTPQHLGNKFLNFRKLLHRDRRLSHYLEISEIVVRYPDEFMSGLEMALSRVWSGHSSDSSWKKMDRPNARWWTMKTASISESGQHSQQVHYNFLDGTFLVDGKPIGRLPREMVNHPTYKRIFGEKILDVVPASMNGMDFMTGSEISGHKVFFALRHHGLILRAKTRSNPSQVLELIPRDILQKDIPSLFSSDYIHWMNVDNGVIEFRPLGRAWDTSPKNWRLHFVINGPSTLIHGTSGTRSLVDIRSSTFAGIAARISPLEHPRYLTVTYNKGSQRDTIFIDLPRLQLSFFLSENTLESKNMPGMIIDDDQSMGTMIGLCNRLVLRHKDPVFASFPRSRSVLIPYGAITFSRSLDENHVCVQINTEVGQQVTWYKYEIDLDLGMLVGNVDITSRLYRIYLHALCSHPLPDPLTCQTGTDHALQELVAAGTFSFRNLAVEDVKLLGLIGKLTPSRSWYPESLRCMQITSWSALLPAFSQHAAFSTCVQSISEYARSLTIFGQKEHETINLGHFDADSFLNKRAIWRTTGYYSQPFTTPSDTRHEARDSPHIGAYDSLGFEALNTARLVVSWPQGLTCSLKSNELLETFKGWKNMQGPVQNDTLTYTTEWLNVDLPNRWLTIYNICRQQFPNKFQLAFSLAAISYGMPKYQRYIPILLSFATTQEELHFLAPPEHSSYDLTDGFEPLPDSLRKMIISGRHGLEDSPSAQISRNFLETSQELVTRRERHYNDTPQDRINASVEFLSCQWEKFRRRGSLQSPFQYSDDHHWFKTDDIMRNVKAYFASCSHNKDLLSFTSAVTAILQTHTFHPSPATGLMTRFTFAPQFNQNNGTSHCPMTLERLLGMSGRSPPKLFGHKFGAGLPLYHAQHQLSTDTTGLESLISKFQRNCQSSFTEVFSKRLEISRKELGKNKVISHCLEYRQQCIDRLDSALSSIRSALEPSISNPRETVLMTSGMWPLIHPRALLKSLSSTSNTHPTSEWTKILTKLAELFIEYQLSQRLVAYAHRSEFDNFTKELENASFSQSDAENYQDWLLVQIQGNFITRAVQSEISHEMIYPSSGKNTVLQLNMGEGKSHVIVPLVTVALADSKRLVRVVVSKPLAGQMFHLLTERISGLTNRRVFYLPFSRDVEVNNIDHVWSIRKLFEECAREHGVLVAQPEHILSFKLMVVDRLLTSSPLDQSVQDLQKIQEWLNATSRDVLDESDDLLHVRYQLIYTMNEQRPFDGGPHRWTITQKILDLARCHMKQLHDIQKFSQEVELLGTTAFEGQFPHVRLLGRAASEELMDRISEDAVDGKLDYLTFVGLSPNLREAVLCFIKHRHISDDKYQIVKRTYEHTGQWKGLLVLRGLLAHGILTYVLSRQRWRVDYGLDSARSLLAVPYRAKDMPSARSEFGHPDVAICLTCLSYYYGGLTDKQVQICFDLLAKLDNPLLEYQNWVERGGQDIPEKFAELRGVNTKDADTFAGVIIPMLRYNQTVIDFFLSHVVFPKAAKEFVSKLGTSGWDLAEEKTNVTTGFSGTNDNNDLLPTSIAPANGEKQLATNAQVLEYLLRPENEHYICTESSKGQPCVFFDADQLSVISKDGLVEPLYSSPFYQRLNECIVYLDDAHTRGTDLKLPPHYRAADRLVQGCMRMRKLGHGQSVLFCAPPEVDNRIRETQKLADSETVKVMDVLSWVMSRTCDDIEDHVPHWVEQGVDHHNRKAIDFTASTSSEEIERLKEAWLQPAARSLDDMYGVSNVESSSLSSVDHIPEMRQRLDDLRVEMVRDARMEEEQEREVSHELEQERQVERPPKVKPAEHHLDNEVRSLVQSGVMPTKPINLLPLMTPLSTPSVKLRPQNPWSKELLCTRDFMTTTQNGKEKTELTSYLRPVQWILSHTRRDGRMILIVMSPYEVNALLKDIRNSKYVRLHMYAPRTTQAMKPLDDLTFYCIPPLPQGDNVWTPPSLDVRCQLNIWGGQLYLDKYETYLRLCLLLGISSGEDKGYTSVESDRFVSKAGRVGEMVQACLFDESPITLLKTLFGLRRKGMSFDLTDMGRILSARLVLPEHFDKRACKEGGKNVEENPGS
ncbi:hypothetical protein CPB84DRAFT_1815184 [Gymnopilus junonius]|uniref:ubiquitinyl hydrolase 1 n=1 Tax=Gymnopilus junonius TaxID=109634 RepID=A0A9P5TNS0_GYMJU|nr:hypothetical protein CPB84DRAFT_1815184 [Gymnopilus junonius]